jgi:hypothetical protein
MALMSEFTSSASSKDGKRLVNNKTLFFFSANVSPVGTFSTTQIGTPTTTTTIIIK